METLGIPISEMLTHTTTLVVVVAITWWRVARIEKQMSEHASLDSERHERYIQDQLRLAEKLARLDNGVNYGEGGSGAKRIRR